MCVSCSVCVWLVVAVFVQCPLHTGEEEHSCKVEDIQALAHPALRHRILVNYRAEAEGVNVDNVIDKLIETVSAPSES